jgi:hypothetical protein
MTFAFPLLPGADGAECGVSAMLASTEAEL